MTVTDSPALRRRLRVELKKARNARSLTQKEVAEKLEWSLSKIIRIESGSTSISVTDLKALLGVYEVDDRFEELAAMARASKREPFSAFRDMLPAETLRYFGYEMAASVIRQCENAIVPGLLQTESYTRALLTDTFRLDQETVLRHVEIRKIRQARFRGATPPETHYIIDEAAIRRMVGGRTVMQEQLARLVELSHRPNTTIQVLPFDLGAHFAMRGPFTYLEFPGEDDDDVLYLENARGDSVFKDDLEVTGPYLDAFLEMADKEATKPDDLEQFITFGDSNRRH
jgi:transcriptional regulator with XRE-family HTH domain